MKSERNSVRTNVLGVGVSALDMDEAVVDLLTARERGKSGYVCVTGVHGVIESQRDPELKRIHNCSLMTVPDGMPTVWMGREQGFSKMGRVYGPDLMLRLMEATALRQRTEDGGRRSEDGGQRTEVGGRRSEDGGQRTEDGGLRSEDGERKSEDGGRRTEDGGGQSSVISHQFSAKKCFTHFLYGSTPEVLEKLKTNLEKRFPVVRIVGTYAPPFRPLNEAEEEGLRQIVAECKPDFFWVGLSTPKQEQFMAAHCPQGCEQHELQRTEVRGQTSGSDLCPPSSVLSPPSSVLRPPKYPLEAGIMLGVGAAFDIHAGVRKDAPEWIKNSGLQWLHRLCQEPRRLWRRYLDIVPKFIGLATLQVLGIKRYELED